MNKDIKAMIQNVRDNNLQSANDIIKKVMEEKLKEKIKLGKMHKGRLDFDV
jgi:hypothetical protein